MRFLILIVIGLFTIELNAVKQMIQRYITQDSEVSFQYDSRLNYYQLTDNQWQQYSRFQFDIWFPNLESYLDISPVFQSIHVFDHLNDSTSAQSRLTEAYIQILYDWGAINIGEKRLVFQKSTFIGSNEFSNLPQTFGHIGITTNDQTFSFAYVTSYTPSNSIHSTQYKYGSIFTDFSLPVFHSMEPRVSAYFIENHSDTFSLNLSIQSGLFQSLSTSISYQDAPLISTNSELQPCSYFYDLIYSIQSPLNEFQIGLRTFGGPLRSSSTGFAAPFSDIFLWDGILSTYGDNVLNGFDSGQRIYFASFSSRLSDHRQVGVSAYLFRSLDFADNQGAEIDLVYSDNIVANLASYQYIAGYFFKGTDTTTNNIDSEFRMWLDVSLHLGQPPEKK
tara:strand:- start:680 stop:1852 length:1173 start_codon:yes stop_codon:yes gene_type:complete